MAAPEAAAASAAGPRMSVTGVTPLAHTLLEAKPFVVPDTVDQVRRAVCAVCLVLAACVRVVCGCVSVRVSVCVVAWA